MNDEKIICRCVLCGTEFTESQVSGFNECPNCGTGSSPCGVDHDLNVDINWHELRILVIWAEQWALHTNCDVNIIYAIANRLMRQHPQKPVLGLVNEINLLKQAFPDADVQNNYPDDLTGE